MNDLKWTLSEPAGPDSLSRSRLAQARAVLVAADLLREQIRQWQEAHGIEPEDSIETLNRLRIERDDELQTPLGSKQKLIRRNRP